jgi:hypothetical protein
MRKDDNWILNELVKHKDRPTRLNNFRYTYNRQQLLKDYTNQAYQLVQKGHDVIERFNKFRDFIVKCKLIKGTTDGGRRFTLEYNEDAMTIYSRYGISNDPQPRWLVRIFDKDDCVYEPATKLSDVMNYSILSAVNTYESKFWNGCRIINKTERSMIKSEGLYENMKWKVLIEVNAGTVTANFTYDGETKNMWINVDPPSHIPRDQWHRYKVRTLSQPTSLKKNLTDVIKSNYMICCGYRPSNDENFCSRCGRQFEVEELTIGDINTSHLETLLK